MGAKTSSMPCTARLRLEVHFSSHEPGKEMQLTRAMEDIIDAVLLEYPWNSDFRGTWGSSGNCTFKKLAVPDPHHWVRYRHNEHTISGGESGHFTLSFLLFYPVEVLIKESQFFSVVRYSEKLLDMLSARFPNLVVYNEISVRPVLEPRSNALLLRGRYAKPGDIVARKSQPSKYFYFDCMSRDKNSCELIGIDKVGSCPDRITTQYDLSELKPVDHFPQMTDEEGICLCHGLSLGKREHLIAKWRPQQLVAGGGRMY